MYNYKDHIGWLASEEGQKAIMRTLVNALKLHETAGCFSEDKVGADMGTCDSWNRLAVIDHLVRFGYLRRLDSGESRPAYYRYFE